MNYIVYFKKVIRKNYDGILERLYWFSAFKISVYGVGNANLIHRK